MKLGAWSLLCAVALGCSSAGSSTPTLADAGSSGASGAGQDGGGSAGANDAGSAGRALGGDGGSGTGMGGLGGVGNGGGGGANAGGGTGGAGSAGAGGAPPVGPPALRWLGRVELTAGGARIAWPGTGFTARFNGTGAHVSLKTNADDFFELVVDGKATVLPTPSGTRVYDLAKNLSAGDHEVTLWRRTEPLNQVAEVGAVTFDGTLLAPPAPSTKHLEIVGDSISVGFGVECKAIGESFTYATENNFLTYQALTARKLGAELFTEAWSGIGMWRDVGGSSDAASQMPARFTRTLPNDAMSAWTFTKYTPDAVVVLLGTNDFAKGDPGQPFVDAYKAFVASLRTRYPKARQYYAVSPMLGGANRTAHKAYLGQVVVARNDAGDKNVAIIEFAQPASDAWGCGHPNAATHAIMAGVLEQALTADLGW